jgi:small-conductance mechanosensitive channel
MVDVSPIKEFVLPVSMVLGGFLLGVVLEAIIRRVIKRVIHETQWELDKNIGHALHRTLIFIFTLIGTYGAVHTMTLDRNIIAVAHQVLLVLMILVITVVLMRFAVDLVELYSRRVGGVFVSTSIFANLTRFIVFLIGLLMALQSLGISIAPILTALGVGGLAVALALQDTLSNLFSGIHVIASKQIRLGDYIKLNTGEEGYVTDITWRYTTVKASANNMIIVPNSKLASAIVTNYYFPEKELFITVPVVVSYDCDLEEIEKLAVEVATDVGKEIPGGVRSFLPFIRFQKLGQFGVSLNVVFKVEEFNDQFLVRHEFISIFHRRAREKGIELVSVPRSIPA